MSIKYFCILGIISVLESQINAKVEVQNHKNVLQVPINIHSQRNIKVTPIIKLTDENKRPSNVHKSAKKIGNSYRLPKLAKKRPKSPRAELKNDKRHRKNTENHHIYLKTPKIGKKLPESTVLPIYAESKIEAKIRKSKKMPIAEDSRKSDKKSVKRTREPSTNTSKHQSRGKIIKQHHKSSGESETYAQSPRTPIKHQDSVEMPSIYMKPPEIGGKDYYKNYRKQWPKKKNSGKKFRKSSDKINNNNRHNHDKSTSNSDENRQRHRHYVRDHDPMRKNHEEPINDDNRNNNHRHRNNRNNSNKNNKKNNQDDEAEKSASNEESSVEDDNRVDFHIHGYDGPDSYVFGYDTGKGDNRQFRWEQRHDNGTVTGQYGYYEPTGKFKKIFYRSDPFYGYSQNALSEEDHANNLMRNEN